DARAYAFFFPLHVVLADARQRSAGELAMSRRFGFLGHVLEDVRRDDETAARHVWRHTFSFETLRAVRRKISSPASLSSCSANRRRELILGVQVDQRHKLSSLIRSDRSGLRHSGHVPARR